jgi:membrane protein implicated in regulation of membrane protease activity
MITNVLSKPELFWFLLGLVLFLMELVIPGFFIFFFGLAVVSVISLIALRRIIQRKFFYSKGTESEDVEDEFTGKEALATIDFGGMKKGKVEFKGTTWTAESSSEIKEGERVKIIEKDSFKLIVEPKK